MQKKIISLFFAVLFIVSFSAAAVNSKDNSASADNAANLFPEHDLSFYNQFFTFKLAGKWDKDFDIDSNKRKNIYFIRAYKMSSGRLATNIFIKYYNGEKAQFTAAEQYIEANSKDIFGNTESKIFVFEPVSFAKVNGKKTSVIQRKIFQFFNYNSKSSDGAWRKEKIYVIPASKGFYVLHYSAEESEYPKHIKEFEKLVKSFRGKM